MGQSTSGPCFGPFELDLAAAELRKGNYKIRLQEKPFQILARLLERPGMVVTREELHELLWPGNQFVEFDHNLNNAINKLREALNDSAEKPQYIETIPRRGYRFIAEITWNGHPAKQAAELPQIPAAGEAAASLLTTRTRWMWITGIALTAVVVLAAFVFWPSRVSEKKIMLVVLPFKNLSGDPGQEYFTDGMTEEISAQLGNLNPHRLGVIGRTSAMTYKQSPKTISQIGKDLAVDFVLEGSVQRDGNKLRVTAQLVQVSDQTHVWAENYDRDVHDLLQLENEVAGKIARQVGVLIDGNKPERSVAPHIPDLEAHEAYVLGRYNWNKRTPSGWKTAAEYFRRSIEKDPQYAAAYSGLASCFIPYRESQSAAKKAVDLDPKSGEAHAALGWVELYQGLDLAAAESELELAIQLDPNFSGAHHTYSELLAMKGHWQESIAEARQASRLDPLALINRAALANVLSLAGQNDVAVQQLNLVLDLNPQFPKAHEVLGNIYMRKSMYEEAIREYQMSGRYGGDKLLAILGHAYARSGKKTEALRLLSQLKELEKRSGESASDLAIVEIGLGNKDETLAWLEKAYQKGDDDGLLWLKVDPMFAPIRSVPRFQNLLRRMNFPPS